MTKKKKKIILIQNIRSMRITQSDTLFLVIQVSNVTLKHNYGDNFHGTHTYEA